jgi:hypothetical protein
MTNEFTTFITTHELAPAADELTGYAVVALERLLVLASQREVDSLDGLTALREAAQQLVGQLPQAPMPATDGASVSPWTMPLVLVIRRAARRLNDMLIEHDAGEFIHAVDVACEVADLVEALAGLAAQVQADIGWGAA